MMIVRWWRRMARRWIHKIFSVRRVLKKNKLNKNESQRNRAELAQLDRIARLFEFFFFIYFARYARLKKAILRARHKKVCSKLKLRDNMPITFIFFFVLCLKVTLLFLLFHFKNIANGCVWWYNFFGCLFKNSNEDVLRLWCAFGCLFLCVDVPHLLPLRWFQVRVLCCTVNQFLRAKLELKSYY